MKLYLAMEYSDCLMEGTFEECLGVFSTPEKAIHELSDCMWFQEADQKSATSWEYIYDGEMTMRFEVKEAQLDESLSN